jgi:hypothetical protein
MLSTAREGWVASLVAISPPASSVQSPTFHWGTRAPQIQQRSAHSATFASLLDRAEVHGYLYEADVERFLDTLPFDPSGQLRGAVLQELFQARITLLEDPIPSTPDGLDQLLKGLAYWKKVIALGLLTSAILGLEVMLNLRTPALPWP